MLHRNSVVAALLVACGAVQDVRADEIAGLKQQAADLQRQNDLLQQRLSRLEQTQAAPSRADFLSQVAKGPAAVIADDGPLTFKGITLFGVIDGGVGYASRGLPINGKLYVGDYLVSKYATHPYFGFAPNGLSQSSLGIKGTQEILPGLSGVFMAQTGINPQSGQLANAPGSLVDNQGLNRNAYSNLADGSRGGQAFNDQLYVGLSSKTYGQLTVGRHRSLTMDLVAAYDPTGAAYAFSVIAYSGGPVAGLGDTENARWDNSLKYRVEYGPARFGALYKFADGNGGCNYTGTLTAPAGTAQQCFTSKNGSDAVLMALRPQQRHLRDMFA